MRRCLRRLGIVLGIALVMACGDDALPPAEPLAPAAPSLLAQTQPPGDAERVIMGTGEVTGAYYRIGEAIAAVLNRKSSNYKIHCTVEGTGGSLVNVHALMVGDVQFGLVQSQRNHEAAKGIGNWKARGAQKDLRSVFSLPFDPAPPALPADPIDPGSEDSAAPDGPAPYSGMTTLVTSAQVPEQVVYRFTRAVFENLSALQDLDPAFQAPDPRSMLQGLSAPIHPGALKYYRERGWK